MESQARPKVLVFGGTTEGRDIARWLGERGTCTVFVSSLTEYGGTRVDGFPNVVSLTGRMLPDRMEALMREHGFACVVDATHPYAANVSVSITAATQATGTPLLRVLREGEPEGPWTGVDDTRAAARHIAQGEGAVLLTTGSKELPVYVEEIPAFQERLYARILPVASSLAQATELGIPTSHIIAMQGPFSKELNVALIREFAIRTVVTKASGKAGGFWERSRRRRNAVRSWWSSIDRTAKKKASTWTLRCTCWRRSTTCKRARGGRLERSALRVRNGATS